ncbi:glycosyltransferase involved in cell wall biosynthesis [Metabacillus crassostreae]|uniref:glycosyltransferase n=1 Tax=Metabacillus crassostreae TaxID=929098 RepID=UPI00195DFD77|nr:glycosyltransferase [Metabacillus crassostreae]MBM7606268.1 glycosyltransferase involved in cell wall biosynthesis [Metabacillus crassostreae]
MLKEELLKRLDKVRFTRAKKLGYKTPDDILRSNENPLYSEGISIIIPTYKGQDVIKGCLESLARQTLNQSLFEVIIVINGEKDNTEEVIKDFAETNKMTNIKIIVMDEAGASVARNKGISLASRQYCTFVDDDDYLSENFLEEMYRLSDLNTIVISQIHNVEVDGKIQSSNPLNRQILKSVISRQHPYNKLNMVLTINACKLIPTMSLQQFRFDETLRSGEDVAFFTDLVIKNDFKYVVAPIAKKVIYYRVLRDNSVSRQKMTFDFNVVQRADVIGKLNELLSVDELAPVKRGFIERKILAQSSFIKKYYEEHQNQYGEIMEELTLRYFTYFPYHLLNEKRVERLVISYCFPPYNDTSGNVMAKRMREASKVSDVIYNTMDSARSKSYTLNKMVDDLINSRMPINSPTSFSNWRDIKAFIEMGMQEIEEKVKGRGAYKEVVSRALWPASHFLAYQYKRQYPESRWIAEFSDPLLFDIEAKKRQVDIADNQYIKSLETSVKKEGMPAGNTDNLFFWCEYLPYVFADELIFTNKHQLKYMMDVFPINEVKEIIKKKAIIAPHPTLPERYYHLEEVDYPLISDDHVNLAYFGNFYSKRNLNDIFEGLKLTGDNVRQRILVHVFTSKPQELEYSLKGDLLEDNIIVNGYVDFYKFLNLCTQFDCLIVNDSTTLDNKDINPYLPSKLSDYSGSGSEIWGIYEEGSILSESDHVEYLTPLNDFKAAAEVYTQLMNKKFKH